jgi:hypothetical protein
MGRVGNCSSHSTSTFLFSVANKQHLKITEKGHYMMLLLGLEQQVL